MVTDMLKIEVIEDNLKNIVLKHYFEGTINEKSPDNFEGYFYIDKDGRPVFVVEEITT